MITHRPFQHVVEPRQLDGCLAHGPFGVEHKEPGVTKVEKAGARSGRDLSVADDHRAATGDGKERIEGNDVALSLVVARDVQVRDPAGDGGRRDEILIAVLFDEAVVDVDDIGNREMILVVMVYAFAVLAVLGGISGLARMSFPFSVFGAACGIVGPAFFFGIPGLVLIAKSAREFERR